MRPVLLLLCFVVSAFALIDSKEKMITGETEFIKSWLSGAPAAREAVPSFDGWTINDCDLSQDIPHTYIFKGVKDLTLIKCDILNADFEAGTIATMDACLNFIVYGYKTKPVNSEKNFTQYPVLASNGDRFAKCNLGRMLAGTTVTTAKDLHFYGCNLSNVKIDPTWIIEDCNTFQGDIKIEPEPDPVEMEIRETAAKVEELAKQYPELVPKEWLK